ncbi:MAG: S41 family peptidase [Anaerolineae bacterium]
MNAHESQRASSAAHTTRTVLAVVIGAALLVLGFAAGAVTAWVVGPNLGEIVARLPGNLTANQAEEGADMDIFWEAWSILESEYVNPEALESEEMVRAATAGMVSSLGDPHTTFVDPVQTTIMDEDMSGSFEGIGATVDQAEEGILIVRPIAGSPAERAGLLAGDIILAADGQSLKGMSVTDAITYIRGERGTVVILTIQREGIAEPFDVPVTRDRVEVPVVESRMLEDHIAYLRLTEFNAVSRAQVRAALDALLAEEPAGIVFDLRGNPGGYLQSSVDIASEFLPLRSLILIEEQRGHPLKEYRVARRGRATEIPLVVLVDGGSASAAEIVAGALQENERAILIGEKTYGKGSVQQTHTLEDGSSLHVTIAKWNLPSGANLDGNGLDPDIQVSFTTEDAEAGRDAQLERAVAYLLNGE